MDPSWKNQTRSPKPNQNAVACWFEEVFNATWKCLKWSALARCVLGAASFLPGAGLDVWRFGNEHGELWNLWGPQTGPSSVSAGVAFAIYLLSVWIADMMPTFGNPHGEKIYHTFESFWHRYLAEHRQPIDRVGHVFEFFGVAIFMALNTGRLTAFSLTLGLGALLTRPLLHIGRARIENDLMYMIGASVAVFYGVPVSYALGYAIWLAFDFTGHAYIGENASAAAFLGKHYLGWALVGQSWFATQVALDFPSELSEALRCWNTVTLVT